MRSKTYKSNHAFTLLELMVAVAIIGIMVGIAIPNVVDWVPRYQLRGAAREIASDIRLVRQVAVKDNTNIVMCFDENANSYWTESTSGICDIKNPVFSEPLSSLKDLSGEYQGRIAFNIKSGVSYANFGSNGMVSPAGALPQITISRSDGAENLVLNMSTAGNVTIDRN